MLKEYLASLPRCILTQNDCYKKGEKFTPKGIMMHSTGADNPTLKRYLAPDDGIIGKNQYNNHWNMAGVKKCVHAMIGLDKDGNVIPYQLLPWDMRSWHCGRSGNDTHISIEICEDSLNDATYFLATKDVAVKLCAALCVEFGFDPLAPGVLLDHKEGNDLGIASGHVDVGHWWGKFGYTMDMFRAEVKAYMVNDGPAQPPVVEDEDETGDGKTPLESRVAALEAAVGKRYNSVEECPAWAQADIAVLVNSGVLKGNGNGLDLAPDLLRALIVCKRYMESRVV